MKRFVLSLIVGGTMASGAVALSPREAFVTAPRDVIAAVDSITRLDMIDYYDSGATVASRNDFGGDVRVKMMTDDAVTVATSGSSEATIVVLQGGKDSMLLVINTLALPVPDSHAVMYRGDWTKAARKLQLPDHNDLSMWLTPEGKKHVDEVENIVPFITAIYSYGDGVLSVTNTLGRLLPADDYKKIKQYLIPSVSYRWNGKKWVSK